jgi:hypothetical protein
MSDLKEENKEQQPLQVSSYENNKLGAIDQIVGRIISRKFFVFLTATGLLTWSNLSSDTWGMIAVIYIGGQTVIDTAIAWKHGNR